MEIGPFGYWTLGDFVTIDLIAATTNAFNGAILARQPSHFRSFTLVGILLIAVLGGIGGGVTRDVLLNSIPSAFANPWYIILCSVAAAVAIRVAVSLDQSRVSRLFDFMATFSLPWYAAIGVSKALDADLPLLACILIGVIGPTAGRFFIDIACGVTPQHFVRGEWFVGTAVLTSVVFILADGVGLTIWPATLIAVAFGASFRYLARRRRWEEPMPRQPDGTAVLSS